MIKKSAILLKMNALLNKKIIQNYNSKKALLCQIKKNKKINNRIFKLLKLV